MRPRRASSDHDETVARRLAQLSAEIAAVRDPASDEHPAPDAATTPVEAPAPVEAWWTGHTRVSGGEPGTPRPHPPPSGPPAGPPVEPPRRASAPVPRSPGQLLHGGRPAPAVPVPGRHAARRSSPIPLPARSSLPLGERLLLGPGQLAVVAVLVAVGLAAVTLWVVRGDAGAPAPVAQQSGAAPLVPLGTAAVPAAAAPPSGASTVPAAGATGGSVTVDVAGKVRRPGIVVLDTGARVVDALKAAGGARPGVELSTLNLARLLVDGEQLLVGVAGAAPAAAAPISGLPGATPAGPLVNLNSATQAELESLPEVGPVTAQAILAWRNQNGGFTSVQELLEVDGIGEATLAQIAPYVTL